MAEPKTLSEKIWEGHAVPSPLQEAARLRALAEGGQSDAQQLLSERPELLYVDLHLVQEVTSGQAFEGLRMAGRKVRRPDLTLVTVDHNVPTTDRDKPWPDPLSVQQVEVLETNVREFGLPFYGINDVRQGIVH